MVANVICTPVSTRAAFQVAIRVPSLAGVSRSAQSDTVSVKVAGKACALPITGNINAKTPMRRQDYRNKSATTAATTMTSSRVASNCPTCTRIT